jgi:SAM-dependent methyltransferase
VELDWLAANRANWDERVPIHVASDFYDVEGFVGGVSSLDAFEVSEIGAIVKDRTLVHLQCHFGLDTLSLARLGASVTGLDFSAPAIAAARELAGVAGVEARFVEGNVYDAPALLGERYDVVYTGKGAINWLPDIEGWAGVLAAVCKPGGTVYVSEFHPFSWVFADEGLEVEYGYFHTDEPVVFDEPGTYTDPDAVLRHTRTLEWAHPIGDIVSALVAAGLRIEFLHEFAHTHFQRWPFLTRVGPARRYELPDSIPPLPLMFSLLATKPG